MSLTSQDFVRGIDISGLTTVSASQLIQLVDAGRSASDKGLTILTTDDALNSPVVPNPDIILEGVTPIWWKRYIWIRVPFNNIGFVILYAWNEQLTSGPIYLKWQSTGADITALTALVNNLNTTVQIVGTEQTAQGAAIAILQASQGNDNILIGQLLNNVASLQNQLTILWPIGSYRVTATLEADSGYWCIADGRALIRASYPALFTAIGTLYGVGDGTTTFNIPDARSRMQIGASRSGSVPAGLTQRTVNNPGGAESHTLTGAESGTSAHQHGIARDIVNSAGVAGSNSILVGNGSPKTVFSDLSVEVNAISAHSIMNPFIAGFIMLRIA